MELAKLGRYELRTVLGKGAMGVVYEGFDTTLSRRVAVKTILKSVGIDAATAADYAARFEREAKAVARFNHPNIVQVYDFGEENEVAYLVMEFIEGRELRSFFVEQAKFDLTEAVRIMGELLDALDFAHEAGVIHRDVKPANVMIDSRMRVKLADFGVSRIQESDQSQVGTMVGTPAFMSPEQIAGGKIDRRTDVFSAGTILYQLLTGDQPFKGGGAWTVAKMIMEEDPPSPSTKVFTVSPLFDAIVNKALAKKPEQRYQSAREFAQALRETLKMVAPGSDAPKAVEALASETEVEFWRSIQYSTDADEFEFYLKQFPQGTYAALAQHKIKQARQAAALAKFEAESASAAPADPEATVALSKPAVAPPPAAPAPVPSPPPPVERTAVAPPPPPLPPPQAKRSMAIPAIAAAVVVVAGAATFYMMGRTPAPTPVAEAPKAALAPAPAAPTAPALDEGKIRKEVEERLRREYAEKLAADQSASKAAVEKLAAEKALADKVLAEKLAAAKNAGERAALEKAAADKAAADKLAAEKAASEKLAAEKAASEKAVAERIASEKAAAEKAVVDKAAAEKVAAEKAAAEKTAAAKAIARRPGVPAVGDRWVYEAVDADNSSRRFQVTYETRAVNGAIVTDFVQGPNQSLEKTHKNAPAVSQIGPGLVVFSPYLRGFQDMKEGTRWKDIEFDRLFRCAELGGCEVSGRIAGRERVTVKAGSFDTTKVIIEVKILTERGVILVEMQYWYADSANRYVKYQMRANSPTFRQPHMDMELVNFTPAK